jgi:invasion protein IalB
MKYRTPAGAAKVTALSISATVALTFAGAPNGFAQQSTTNAPALPIQGPDAGQAQQAAPSETAQKDQHLQLIASPWTRYCATGPMAKSSEISTKEVCFTASDAHLASGEKVVIALLIEPEGVDKKILRVTLPLGVALVPGARIVIDDKEAMTAPYVVCLAKNGCMADYRADTDLIAKLKKGRSLAIQAFDKGRPIGFTLPLTDFAKAYDGPPSDPTGLNDRQQSLPNELHGRYEDHLDTPSSK